MSLAPADQVQTKTGIPATPRRRRSLLACLALIGVAGAAFIAWTALSIARYAQVDETRRSDAAIVLGAAVYGTEPSPVFRERIRHAVTLYQNGTVDYLVFTGGVGVKASLAESIVGRNTAIAGGVSPERILVETSSSSTRENLRNALAVGTAQGLATYLIVSDPLHMKRAMLVAGRLKMEAYSSPTPTSRYRSLRARMQFLAREEYYYTRYLLLGW